jgi:hypothetical protein
LLVPSFALGLPAPRFSLRGVVSPSILFGFASPSFLSLGLPAPLLLVVSLWGCQPLVSLSTNNEHQQQRRCSRSFVRRYTLTFPVFQWEEREVVVRTSVRRAFLLRATLPRVVVVVVVTDATAARGSHVNHCNTSRRHRRYRTFVLSSRHHQTTRDNGITHAVHIREQTGKTDPIQD